MILIIIEIKIKSDQQKYSIDINLMYLSPASPKIALFKISIPASTKSETPVHSRHQGFTKSEALISIYRFFSFFWALQIKPAPTHISGWSPIWKRYHRISNHFKYWIPFRFLRTQNIVSLIINQRVKAKFLNMVNM